MNGKRYDLDERLLEYAAEIVRLTENMPKTRAGTHIGGQLLRSGTSPLLNHGEAQSAESQKDFVHKMKVCLKELRESDRAVRLVLKVPLVERSPTIDALVQETDELIRIFIASIRTAQSKAVNEDSEDYDI